MPDIVHIADDLVSVKKLTKKMGKFVLSGEKVVLAWGDRVEILEEKKVSGKTRTRIRVHGHRKASFFGQVNKKLKTQKKGVFQFSLVDVQQGDGMVIETPEGKVILVDGGDNKLFARYLAARYHGTTEKKPLEVEAMIVTHGDADHFAGLREIEKSEKQSTAKKRLFIYPKRVYHNGLVKGPSKLKADKIFGKSVVRGKERFAVQLEDDLLQVSESRLNVPFKGWIKSLTHWAKQGPIEFRRLAFGDDNAFDFLNSENIGVNVLGPFLAKVNNGSKTVDALPLLRTPPKTVDIHLQDGRDKTDRPFSASHTVNGHSIALRFVVGNVRLMLTGDLNQEAMEILRDKTTNKDLESEIIKAPHHGSADFDIKALKAMSPVVSLISSGDESSRKEHIHPRATLLGALGKVSRGDTPIVLCTELSAFFAMEGMSNSDAGKRFFAFQRTNFGIVQIRTDGSRVLVFTHSGKSGMKEAYRFSVDSEHKIKFSNIKKG